MDSPAATARGPLLPRALIALGLLALPAGLGAAWGYYAADQGARWVPSMLGWILLLSMFGFGAVGAGVLLGVHVPAKRRRRLLLGIGCLLLGVCCLTGRLALIWIEQPTPLTSLTPEQFNAAFEEDCLRYKELTAGLDRILDHLEQAPALLRSAGVPSADQERLLLDAWQGVYDHAFSLDQIRRLYEDWFRFDASRVQRSYHLRSFLLTFAAELALFEKGSRLVRLIRGNPDAVKTIDTPHPQRGLPGGTLGRFNQEFLGVRDQSRIAAGQRYLRWLQEGLRGRTEAAGLGCGWLWQRVETDLLRVKERSALDKAALSLSADLQPLQRGLRRAWSPAVRRVAEWMGDTRVRRIGRYLITHDQLRPLINKLEPGDILLSRKNWYLSNVGLPGFWPHAILYVGAPEQLLRSFGDVDVRELLSLEPGDPRTLPRFLERRWPARWRRYLEGAGGKPLRVIEAVSEGVVLSTLEHAAGDYLVALRPQLPREVKAQAVIRAFGHLGKPYDYDFDFATGHALVCTELVWRSYRPAGGMEGLRLPLTTLLGRKTLPANDIARVYSEEYGRPGAQFELVGFIDANEQQGRAFSASEQAFRESYRRTKWDIALK